MAISSENRCINPGYTLDHIVQADIRAKIPFSISPAPLSEEDKKRWTIFNLDSLYSELLIEEALQYDWDELRVKLPE